MRSSNQREAFLIAPATKVTPILKMYIPGQIRIFNVLISDGYSTGNAPPSGNNVQYCTESRVTMHCSVVFCDSVYFG